jgi:AraC-like DNA-binding protein
MKNLTISTDIAALRTAAMRLPAPDDYFSGASSAAPVMADQVLMFSRRHSRELGGVPHAHHRFVLLAALAGEGQVVVDQRAHALAPGRAVVIFPFQFHHYVFHRSTKVVWLFTTFELPSDAPLEPLRGKALALTPAHVSDLGRACSLFVRSEDKRAAAEVRLRVALVLTALLPTVHGVRATPSRGGDSELLERVGRYVFAHLHEPVSVTDLARGVGLSETHLRHQLRTRYGLSPHGYVRQVKMLQAMRLLRTGSLSISQIAERLGYSSLFAFSRSFKLETGQSPRAYRKPHLAAG